MRNELGVRTESTGWRDDWISQKHRSWGYDVPASDIDFLLVEYDRMIPKALIEHKTFGCKGQFGMDQVLKWHNPVSILGTMASIPTFIVFYDKDTCKFEVVATNSLAANMTGNKGSFGWDPIAMSERQYVAFLYHIRKRPVPVGLAIRSEVVA